MQAFFPQEISSVIIPFLAITGADTVSSFYGYLKKTEFKKNKEMSKSPKAENLGKHDTLAEDDIMKCSKYLVKYIYICIYNYGCGFIKPDDLPNI